MEFQGMAVRKEDIFKLLFMKLLYYFVFESF
jgi:hypothetical protein